MREGDDGVAIGDETKVAVEGILRIEDDGGGSGGVEGGGDFVADVAGFPDADDDDFAPVLDGVEEECDGAGKIFVEIGGDLLQGFDFHPDDVPGLSQVIHKGELREDGSIFQP